MSDNKDKVEKISGLELPFTQLAKTYAQLGKDLVSCSAYVSAQVDTIELGLWLMKTIDNWNNDTGVELYEYVAEKLKEQFEIIIKPEVTHGDECNCGDHSGK